MSFEDGHTQAPCGVCQRWPGYISAPFISGRPILSRHSWRTHISNRTWNFCTSCVCCCDLFRALSQDLISSEYRILYPSPAMDSKKQEPIGIFHIFFYWKSKYFKQISSDYREIHKYKLQHTCKENSCSSLIVYFKFNVFKAQQNILDFN